MSKTRRWGGTLGIAELMGATLGTARIAKGVQRARAILAWPQAVGPEIAKLTRPRSQQGSTLFVEVRDSATAHHLSMQRHHFLKALNALLGDHPINEIRFSVGTIRSTTKAAAPTPAPLPAPDLERAQALVKGIDGELLPAALRAAEAITRARKWREQQGWRPCPVCNEASKEQPCRACTLSLEDPNVKRAAKLLMRLPERLPTLSGPLGDSGMNAARTLALEELKSQLDLLALECVRSGPKPDSVGQGYREFLLQQAEIYLSLTFRKPRVQLLPSERAALPERTRNVLNSGR
ncbi:DUF721 domain-containing protein [Deinococcus puniceus]|uniref:Zn-finger containing protein n=1 Tax=Deinococcus puniceus TaxID=1182568 RepID=A0A172T8V4_9DEIO|nr:DciA family protein [Deinococcus puniceus]ANE43376.1 Zn-finger containing protein [Deinococcus puniceus]